jgi:AraC-like DNA-binding protein
LIFLPQQPTIWYHTKKKSRESRKNMKAHFQKITLNDEKSFDIGKWELSGFHCDYHYHPEYELKYVIKSEGKRFVGDSVENFKAGDLVLLGPNLPHYWKNDPHYYDSDEQSSSAYIVLFSGDFLGNDFFKTPELYKVNDMLSKSKGGIRFPKANKSTIPDKMQKLLKAKEAQRILIMLDILIELAGIKKHKILAKDFSHDFFIQNIKSGSFGRMQRVHEYVIENFHSHIPIETVADIASMSTHSFCKYFKKSTKKTFTRFLNELRVCHAKKLLIEDNETIAQICYKSGFNNLSYFNRQFKLITNTTPKGYKALYNSSQ